MEEVDNVCCFVIALASLVRWCAASFFLRTSFELRSCASC